MKFKLLVSFLIGMSGTLFYTALQGVFSVEKMNREQEQILLSQLEIGSVYQHYSGKQYRVVAVGRHSEDLSLYVMYEALYDCGDFGQTWIRPLAMFLEEIEVKGLKVQRFSKIAEPIL